ncbi:hypothetical protein LH51_01545 [Nitrincola sp. A-D6]|uniref:hypothetical protein n=1 Tax=Nitrincola sp. A-D6 TaxID=1545442 RepID=UPI00051FB317|nr:hypothetical protein [Nitrincola sp. A-D6]KGK43215.1 hypothetical protein LH51_01545 [Nitrincola sp. A-D6]
MHFQGQAAAVRTAEPIKILTIRPVLPTRYHQQPETLVADVSSCSQLLPSTVLPADFADQWLPASELLQAVVNTADAQTTP